MSRAIHEKEHPLAIYGQIANQSGAQAYSEQQQSQHDSTRFRNTQYSIGGRTSGIPAPGSNSNVPRSDPQGPQYAELLGSPMVANASNNYLHQHFVPMSNSRSNEQSSSPMVDMIGGPFQSRYEITSGGGASTGASTNTINSNRQLLTAQTHDARRRDQNATGLRIRISQKEQRQQQQQQAMPTSVSTPSTLLDLSHLQSTLGYNTLQPNANTLDYVSQQQHGSSPATLINDQRGSSDKHAEQSPQSAFIMESPDMFSSLTSPLSTSSPLQGTPVSPTKPKGPRRDRQRTHTPRPPNSFIIYRREKHLEIMAQYKGSKTLNNNVISKIVADMWRQEDPALKARYAAKAEEEKRAHMLKYPDYKYRPRKNSKSGGGGALGSNISKPSAPIMSMSKHQPGASNVIGAGASNNGRISSAEGKVIITRFDSGNPNKMMHLQQTSASAMSSAHPSSALGSSGGGIGSEGIAVSQSPLIATDGHTYTAIPPTSWTQLATQTIQPNSPHYSHQLVVPTHSFGSAEADATSFLQQLSEGGETSHDPMYRYQVISADNMIMSPTYNSHQQEFFAIDGLLPPNMYSHGWPVAGPMQGVWDIGLDQNQLGSMTTENMAAEMPKT